ncbi:MAG: type IV pilus secretin PilQ, partial [Deltaproteobacteria bacterium]
MRIEADMGLVLRRLFSVAALVMAASVSSNVGAKPGVCRVTTVKLLQLPDGGSEVVVRTDRKPTYSARVAQGGKRLIVDLRHATVAGAEPAITDPQGVVGGVMTQTFMSQGVRTTRVLVQLLRSARYRVKAKGDGLRIVLHESEKTGPVSSKTRSKDSAGGGPAAGPAAKGVSVRNVSFDHSGQIDRVIVQLSASTSHTEHAASPTRSILTLADAALPKALQRTLDVGAFGGNVRAISAYRRDGRVHVDVDHAAGVSGVVVRYGAALHYVFRKGRAPSTLTGVGADGKAARQTKLISAPEPAFDPFALGRGMVDRALGDEWSSEPDVAGAFLPGGIAQQQPARRFGGRRIDLDLKDADIHNVFRIVADVGRVNIVAADNVSGKVTIRMRNVPWDQALDTIL